MRNFLAYLILGILILIASTLFIGITEINGESMAPQLKNGQRAIYLKYLLLEPKLNPSDIVLYNTPNYSNMFVGRIMALPNSKFMIKDGELYLDTGSKTVKYLENYNFSEAKKITTAKQDGNWLELEPNEYLILQDNRTSSITEIEKVTITKDNIVGRIIYKL